jgi:L-cystine uptake protein TcyP (sodium:dicarboxylate symporter family)
MVLNRKNHKNFLKSQKSTKLKNFTKFLKKNLFLVAILFSIVVGFSIGFIIKNSEWSSSEHVKWFTLPGKLFIRGLQMLIVPVVFVGVVAATCSLSTKNNMRMTLISLGFIFITHVLSTLIAFGGSFILKMFTIRNSNFNYNSSIMTTTQNISNSNSKIEYSKSTYDVISDILFNLVPKNLIKSTTHQEITKYIKKDDNSDVLVKETIYIEGTNLLGTF